LTETDRYKQRQRQPFLSINNNIPSKTATNNNFDTRIRSVAHAPALLASNGGQYDPITAVDADQHENQIRKHPTHKGKYYE